MSSASGGLYQLDPPYSRPTQDLQPPFPPPQKQRFEEDQIQVGHRSPVTCVICPGTAGCSAGRTGPGRFGCQTCAHYTHKSASSSNTGLFNFHRTTQFSQDYSIFHRTTQVSHDYSIFTRLLIFFRTTQFSRPCLRPVSAVWTACMAATLPTWRLTAR